MPRIDLQVPFPEKDEARRLGARWDVTAKRWYVPDGIDPTGFDQWLPKRHPPNIRALHWYVAASTRACWRCGSPSRVFAILLPPNYEVLSLADDPMDDRWVVGMSSTLLSYVGDVPNDVAAQLCKLAPRYRVDFSHTINSFYWMNHCEHCEAKLGDFDTIEEVGCFASCVGLVRIDEPFSASCSGAIGDLRM